MKTTGLLLTIALLASCSSAPVSKTASISTHAENVSSDKLPNWGVTQKVRFFNDARPVDGNLNEIVFELSQGKYTAIQQIKHGGLHPTPTQADSVTHLATRLSCENQFSDEIGTLTSVSCQFDARPVDGALVEINARLEDDSTGYSLVKIVTPSGFGTGDTTPIVTELGSNLALEIVENALPKKIECIETRTLADASGFASMLTLNEEEGIATVARKPVRGRGQVEKPWVIDENSYSIKSSTAADGTLSLEFKENVDTNVDWSTAGTCYKFFPIENYSIQRNEFGKWVGEGQLMPIILKNPDVSNCDHPLVQRPPLPQKISCNVVE